MTDAKNEITVRVRMTSEVTRESDHTIDLDEFLEWSNGASPTPRLVKEYIEADRNREEIEDMLWFFGASVDNTVEPLIEIERVTLP